VRIAFIYHFDDHAWLGGRNYFASLFSAIRDARPSTELLLVTGKRTQTTLPEDFPWLRVVRTSHLDRRTAPWAARQLLRSLTGRRYDPLLGGLLDRLGVDVLSHSQPLLARRSRAIAIGWLPDFQFLHLPHLWSDAELERMRQGSSEVCRNADALIVSSADALRDLRSFAPGLAKPAHVLHFTPRRIDFGALIPEADLRRKFDLPDRYFFLPNQFWAHKNHGVVIDALIELKKRGSPVVVVCTGKPVDPRRPAHFEQLMARATEGGIAREFRVLGMVQYTEMLSLMRHSHAVLNPSRFEGWSTTVEEGKAMGKRMILSDIAVHREQAPPLAMYFGPDDPHALADALAEALAQPTAERDAAELDAEHQRRSRQFAEAYLAIVESLRSAAR